MKTLSLLVALLIAIAASPMAHASIVIPTVTGGATTLSDIDSACLGCAVEDLENVISQDLDAHATLSVTLGLASGGSILVTFPTTVAKGSKVGFRIGQQGLLDLAVLEGLTITTYLNGVERVSRGGASLLKLALLSDGTGYVMMNARKSFDEVRIHVGSLVGLSRAIDVYHAFAIPKRIVTTVVEIPTVDSGATADSDAGGVLCVPVVAPCEVTGEDNVVSTTHDDAARINLPVGVGAAAWIDVFFPEDQAGKPKAGFVIESGAGIIDAQLLSALTVTTYRDGSVQQSATGASTLGIKHLDRNKVFVYLRARQLFDQLRITTEALVSVGVQIDVYHSRLQYKIEGRPVVEDTAPVSALLLTAGEEAPLVLASPAPNPTTGLSRLVLMSASTQHVRVRVFDMAGREVAAPFEEQVEAGDSVEVTIDGRALPGGVYVVRAEGEGMLVTQRLTIVR